MCYVYLHSQKWRTLQAEQDCIRDEYTAIKPKGIVLEVLMLVWKSSFSRDQLSPSLSFKVHFLYNIYLTLPFHVSNCVVFYALSKANWIPWQNQLFWNNQGHTIAQTQTSIRRRTVTCQCLQRRLRTLALGNTKRLVPPCKGLSHTRRSFLRCIIKVLLVHPSTAVHYLSSV